MQTAEMVAGKELDCVVEVRMFGQVRWRPHLPLLTCRGESPESCINPVDPRPFSTEIDVAWQLVDRYWSVSMEKCDSTDPPWHVCIWARQGDDPFAEAVGATFPETLCRAALAARGGEVNDG